ncbi:MAG: hypothetical protein ABFQ65_03760, partial [Nanoarchaeota archaeon]
YINSCKKDLFREEFGLVRKYLQTKDEVDFNNLHNFRKRVIAELYGLGLDSRAKRMNLRRNNCYNINLRKICHEAREEIIKEDKEIEKIEALIDNYNTKMKLREKKDLKADALISKLKESGRII